MWRLLMSLMMLSLSVRLFTGLSSHSGEGKPPMYGDFEAQRHWIEITSHVPLSDWYHGQSPANNLSYWGLDYPPLTAYHSFAMGQVGMALQPHSFALLDSRGAEDYATKSFMRLSVIVSDVLVYLPAVMFFLVSRGASRGALLFAMVQPALVLVDHGHFQYNGVCLGLVALAATLLDGGSFSSELVASALFVMALNFKHMALYFAPSFFVVLLSRHLHLLRAPTQSVVRLGLIGVVVLSSFALLWWPFLRLPDRGLQVLVRLFPVGRGIFEDKVANVWCALGPLFRFKDRFAADVLFRIAGGATLTALVPGGVLLFLKPSSHMFLLSLASSSLSFFLCAFQVHEKNILMPLLPLSLLFASHPHFVSWVVTIACFSMFPLLERDGLLVAYGVAIVALLFVFGRWNRWSTLSLIPCVVVHLLMAFVPPPPHLPHLWILACVSYSFLCFCLTYGYVIYLQWRELRQKEKVN